MPLEVKYVAVRESFQCCCCQCSVKNGTIIIGWVQLDLSVLLLFLCIAFLVDARRLFPTDATGPVIGIFVLIGACIFVNGLLVFTARRGIPVLALPYLLLGLVALAVMCLIIFKGVAHLLLKPKDIAVLFGHTVLTLLITVQLALRLLIETLLLYGAYREEPMFLLPYIILDPIGILWLASLVILLGIYLAGDFVLSYMMSIIIDSLLVGIRSYMWVIVYSYYRQMVRNICPRNEIPLGNVGSADHREAEPFVSPADEQELVIRTMYHNSTLPEKDVPSIADTVVRVDKRLLWPSSREYLL